MIVKEVPKKKATGSFKGLVDYIEDKLGLHSDKVELVYSENCEFDTIEENVREVKAIQALSDSEADPNYHIVVSFPEDERPTPEQLKIITRELLKSVGMEHHQRICATHTNTNNYHLHIAVNRIDPDTYKRADPYRSQMKLQKKAAELEEKLGLKKDNHIPNWQLAEQNRKTRVNRKANDIKSHTGISNLADWIKTEALDDLKAVLSNDSATLKDLHTTLAKFNLELKERGNGLIIKDKSRNLFCKASDIDRNLSKAKLESKFGKFEAMEINTKPAIQFGTPKNDYWDKYKLLMDLNYKTKKEAMSKLKEQYNKDKELIKNKWKENINKVKVATWHKTLKRETYKKIFENQKKELDELYQKYSLERNEIIKDKKHITYKDYLIQEALKGDEDALAMIRKQKPPAPKEDDNTVGGRTSNRLFIARKPLITKLGYVVYKLDKKDDKSKIIDKGNHLKLVNMSDEALAEGLKMAISKYGKDLNITGDDLFKKKIVEAAHLLNIDVKFKDENMNKTLEALRAQKSVDNSKNSKTNKPIKPVVKDIGRE
ncbi:MAG: hypothetical protein KN64_10725 [Sulfurovum sp. AS07-7]|nr:MAG: hypothetical protein KN64_10725 [Sulfurovum sp. AS07-7]